MQARSTYSVFIFPCCQCKVQEMFIADWQFSDFALYFQGSTPKSLEMLLLDKNKSKYSVNL